MLHVTCYMLNVELVKHMVTVHRGRLAGPHNHMQKMTCFDWSISLALKIDHSPLPLALGQLLKIAQIQQRYCRRVNLKQMGCSKLVNHLGDGLAIGVDHLS